MKNGIVIPCYNEAARLKLNEFQNFIDNNNQYTLCFVNDGSTDETYSKLSAFSAGQEDRVLVYDMPQNGGKAEAVRAGVKHVFENTQVENIGFMDADLATGFDDYKMLVSQLRSTQNEAILGSRKINADLDMERTLFRSAASFLFGKFINSIIGMDIKDTQCGAKVFTRNIAEKVFSMPFQSKWLFDVEVLIRIRNLFGKGRAMNFVKEVALSKWEEVEGSKITFRDSIQFPLQLCQIGIDYNIRPQIKEMNIVLVSAVRSGLTLAGPLNQSNNT